MSDADKNTNPMKKITQLQPATYINNTTLFTLAGVPFTMWKTVLTGLSARMNLGLGGDAGMGKSQLLADIRALYGNNASYVLCRNDMDIRSLFRQMNFRKLQKKLKRLCEKYDKGTASYDKVYDLIEGWCAYTKNANMHNAKRTILRPVGLKFEGEISSKEIDRHLNDC